MRKKYADEIQAIKEKCNHDFRNLRQEFNDTLQKQKGQHRIDLDLCKLEINILKDRVKQFNHLASEMVNFRRVQEENQRLKDVVASLQRMYHLPAGALY